MSADLPERRPFSRLPYGELGELPPRPHPYFRTEPVELSMHTTSFGRLKIHYRVLGEGPPLLLIHGLMTSSYSWRYVLDELSRRFRVVAPDLPGCGRSDKPIDRRYDAAALSTWIGEFQAALNISGCCAAGNSLGGYICLRRALADATSFARLAVVHSPVLPDWRLRALHATLALPGVKPALAWMIRREPERWAHRNVHYYDERLKSLEEAREYGAPLSTKDGVYAFVKWLTEGLAPTTLTRFATELQHRLDQGVEFPVPLLLLYARQDPLVDPAMGEVLNRLVPAARLVRLDRSSHFAQVDRPDAVAQELLSFFDEQVTD
jgi:pimeloyl-ACP methyl ester carboxylesterase